MLIINFAIGKPSRYHCNQVVKINIITNGANPPNMKH